MIQKGMCGRIVYKSVHPETILLFRAFYVREHSNRIISLTLIEWNLEFRKTVEAKKVRLKIRNQIHTEQKNMK